MEKISELSKLKKVLDGKKRVAFVGPSGMGKSWLGAQFKAQQADKFGTKKNGKWVIDPGAAAQTAGSIEGAGENMQEWLLAYKPEAIVIVVLGDPDAYRQIMLGKANHVGINGNFYKNFIEATLKSDSEIRHYVDSKIANIKKFLPKGVPSMIFENKPSNIQKLGGFHGH